MVCPEAVLLLHVCSHLASCQLLPSALLLLMHGSGCLSIGRPQLLRGPGQHCLRAQADFETCRLQGPSLLVMVWNTCAWQGEWCARTKMPLGSPLLDTHTVATAKLAGMPRARRVMVL